MKNKSRIVIGILLIISLLIVCTATVDAETIYESNGFSYQYLNDTYVFVCGWDDSSPYVSIPAKLNGFPVQAIGDSAFKEDNEITTVNFSNASYLKRIGNMAFKDCTALTGTINVPSKITSIGWGAFQGCTGITEANYYYGPGYVSTQCFYQCSSLAKVMIADGITSIEKFAFADCVNLNYVRIPETVEAIDSTAFNNCPNLVIYCYTDSYAQQYAVDNGFDYILLDAPAPTEPPTDPPTDAPTEPSTDPPTDPATEKPSTVPTEVTFILGDADGDGDVNILDATKIQRVLVDLDPDEDGMIALRGNVNNAPDGLNILHATKIQRWIAGFVTEEPIGTSVTVTI